MKVGDYVRTKDGIIDQVIIEYNGYCASPSCNCKHVSCRRNYYDEDKIIKSSPNIIDLIEVGDIVNYGLLGGGMVIFKKDGEITTNTILFSNLKEKDIKKVITKEQIENIEYEVK